MKEVSLKDLLEAGCHFGHQTTRWNPKMQPYIYTARDRIHIFDLVKTKEGLEKAIEFVKKTASEGGQILFVGTKRQALEIVKASARKVNMPYMTERWVGGLLTNWDFLKKRLKYLADLKSGLAEGKFKDRTKKEVLLIGREIAKMEKVFGGITNLTGIPAAIFITDAKKETSAINEARIRGVKIIAIADTNANPDNIDFIIPSNDDATKCLELIIGAITEAIEEGIKEGSKKKEVADEKLEVARETGSESKGKVKKISKKVKKEPSSAEASEGKIK